MISCGRPDDSEPSRGGTQRPKVALNADGDQHAVRVDLGKHGCSPRVTENLASRRGGAHSIAKGGRRDAIDGALLRGFRF
jgi:hypothetical protein